MASSKKPSRDAIAALLRFSADYDQTAEEAEKELRAAGVDVDGFQARLKARLAKQADEDRLAWMTSARAELAKPRHGDAGKYRAMDRTALVANLKARQKSPAQAQAFFHKLDEISDDDLRTLLADLDELDDDEEEPT